MSFEGPFEAKQFYDSVSSSHLLEQETLGMVASFRYLHLLVLCYQVILARKKILVRVVYTQKIFGS